MPLLMETILTGVTSAVPMTISGNNENIGMDGDYTSLEVDYTRSACKENKALIACSQCRRIETLANNGSREINRKTIKCASCTKQYSGDTVLNALDGKPGEE